PLGKFLGHLLKLLLVGLGQRFQGLLGLLLAHAVILQLLLVLLLLLLGLLFELLGQVVELFLHLLGLLGIDLSLLRSLGEGLLGLLQFVLRFLGISIGQRLHHPAHFAFHVLSVDRLGHLLLGFLERFESLSGRFLLQALAHAIQLFDGLAAHFLGSLLRSL